MSQFLPYSKLFQAHNEALDAIKYNHLIGGYEPDHNIRLQAAILGYRLNGIAKLR